ncbi:MAG: hypothetical protein JOZ19_11725 [Rubrobacter sp.]|nr:hypothetical protein [Rubrobacter sp.]
MFLAETMAGIGARLNCSAGRTALGSEINASHVLPKKSSGTVATIATALQRAATPKFGRLGSKMRMSSP